MKKETNGNFVSRSRHLTKDPKTDLKSARSKLSKTVSHRLSKTRDLLNGFLNDIFQIEEKKIAKKSKFFEKKKKKKRPNKKGGV